MINLALNLDWLKVVYIVGALGLLAIAIVAYPSLQARSKKSLKRQSPSN